MGQSKKLIFYSAISLFTQIKRIKVSNGPLKQRVQFDKIEIFHMFIRRIGFMITNKTLAGTFHSKCFIMKRKEKCLKPFYEVV